MGVQADLFSVSQMVLSSLLSLSFLTMSEMKCGFTPRSHAKVLLQGEQQGLFFSHKFLPESSWAHADVTRIACECKVKSENTCRQTKQRDL